MSRAIVGLVFGLIALAGAAAEPRWYFDLPKAQELAKVENKLVLIDFTGSDWCGWCMKLRKEVFLAPEFNDYARSNLVLVEIDQPRYKPFSLEFLQRNSEIQDKYHAEAFPTLVLLNSAGQELWRLGGYAELSISQWCKMFDNLKSGAPATPPPVSTLPQGSQGQK